MLHIQQYMVCIIYKPGPDLYIADYLSQNNIAEDREQKITGMNVNLHAISTSVNIPICTSMEDVQVATRQDKDFQRLQ